MGISFKETAAIELFARQPAATAAKSAQELADACCAAWGHQPERFWLDHPGAGTIAAGGLSQLHRRCRRCEKELSDP